MSKLVCVLAVGALLTAMSLGSTAYAQDGDASSQQAGVTQSDPSQPQPPGTPEDPGTSEDPGTPGDPGTTPGSTTTTPTAPPALLQLTVIGSSRQGRVGTTITLTADLSRCPQLTSASGVFLDHSGRSRPLAGQLITRASRFIAQYTVTARDADGWGRFKITCHRDTTIVGVGNFSFQVLPTPSEPPRELSVTGSSRQGQMGTAVTLSADLRSCPQLTSASGVFLDHSGGRRPLAGQTVTRDGRFIARYAVTARDAVGWGHFKINCYRDTTTVGVGNFSFQVLPPPGRVYVTVTPRAGGPGTTVKLSADVRGGCDPAVAFFQDRKGWRVTGATTPVTILRLTDRQLLAQYTVSSKDAVGWGRFGVSCGMRTDSYRVGYASFRVLSRAVVEPGPLHDPGGPVYHPKGPVQVPTRIDTGLGGTANGGLDPMLLLPAAGLLLIAVAVGLRLRKASRRRP
jgi:hypothetical protein